MAWCPTSLSEKQVRRILALDWKTAHSTRLQRATGDDKLVCAWRGDLGRWVLARLERVAVGRTFGVRSYVSFEELPVVWKVWQSDDGRYLDITDPQLLPYIRKCDNAAGGVERVLAGIELADREADEVPAKMAAELAQIAVDDHRGWRKIADQAGYGVAHRRGGQEGGKISSASLWRESPRSRTTQVSGPLVTLA